MAKSPTIIITCLQLLLVSSIATVNSRPTTLSRRGVSENCDPLLDDCGDQWPFSPISSTDPFMSRPFLRGPTPPLLLPSLPPVVVASPPPTVSDSDPNFSPLVASPPPPGTTIPPAFPELPPDDDDSNAAPPLLALSFSPPADDNFAPEVTLPPIVHRQQPDLYVSPPQLNLPSPDPFDVPPPPLVPIVFQQREIIVPPPPTKK
ncbi:hypothetical protein L1887_20025 [Cichorium endivia]|nr:hypothetical protein L1887_20025 [Cichorium endivia]